MVILSVIDLPDFPFKRLTFAAYQTRNDYEQNHFNLNSKFFNSQRYGTTEDSTNSRAQPVR